MSIDATHIAAAIERSPAWARVGLSVRDERMRTAALGELSRHIAASLIDDQQQGRDADTRR